MGISLVLTSLQTSGISYKYMSTMPNRICLYCNQKDEYGNLFDHCHMQPKNVPGRGLIAIHKEVYEYQSFLAFKGDKEIDRVNDMKQVIEMTNELNKGVHAARIPMVPDLLTEDILVNDFGVQRQDTYTVALGLDYENVGVFSLDLPHMGVLGLLGNNEAVRMNFINGLMYHLYINMFNKPSMVYILDDTHKALKRFENCGIVQRYSLDAGDILDWMEDIHQQLEERMDKDMTAPGIDVPLIVLFIENREAIQILAKNTQGMKLYKDITGKLKDFGGCLVFTNIEDAPVGFGGPELLKILKEQRKLMYFDNLSALKFTDVSNQVLRAYKKELVSGDVYYINGGNVQKIRTAKFSEEWMESWRQ